MDRLLARGQLFLLALSGLYVVILCLLTVPYIQTHAVYLHALRWPLFADLQNPVKYGLPASRSLNLRLETRDKVQLGAWLVTPPSERTGAPIDPLTEGDVYDSVKSRPTILLFHGNAATRAVHFRAQHCSSYAIRFRANVLAIDYRGYGDSEGTPSEGGLVSDARAAWDWAINHGAKPDDILLVGLSLGTGVVSGLGAELASEDIHPRGVILLAPFTSIKSLLNDYHFFGIIPILQPLQFFPPLQEFVAKFLVTRFNTSQALPTIKSHILLAHSTDDVEIPHAHSRSLFNGLTEQYLPPLPSPPISPGEMKNFDWTAYRAIKEKRDVLRSSLVTKQEVPGFGTVHNLTRPNNTGEITFVEARYGAHDRIGLQESVMDLIDVGFF